MTNSYPIKDSVDKFGAFTDFNLSSEEYAFLLNMVREHFSRKVMENLPDIPIPDIHLEDYMRIAHLIDHSRVWTKLARCLNKNDVEALVSSSLIQRLREGIGLFRISDEENLGYGNVYFRIARPNSTQDVGPMHADSWFWQIRNEITSQRIKIWIPLLTYGQNAFQYIPGSHLEKGFTFSAVEKHGLIKPQIDDISLNGKQIIEFGKHAKSAIIFHDDLIHGGLPLSNSIRVSLEFTMILEL
jgi:hypothetical protein